MEGARVSGWKQAINQMAVAYPDRFDKIPINLTPHTNNLTRSLSLATYQEGIPAKKYSQPCKRLLLEWIKPSGHQLPGNKEVKWLTIKPLPWPLTFPSTSVPQDHRGNAAAMKTPTKDSEETFPKQRPGHPQRRGLRDDRQHSQPQTTQSTQLAHPSRSHNQRPGTNR